MKISKKLFLLLCLAFAFCNVIAMDKSEKEQYYAQEIKLNDFEKIIGIDSVSVSPDKTTQATLDLVTITYQLLPSIIVRQHAFVNKRLFQKFCVQRRRSFIQNFC